MRGSDRSKSYPPEGTSGLVAQVRCEAVDRFSPGTTVLLDDSLERASGHSGKKRECRRSELREKMRVYFQT